VKNNTANIFIGLLRAQMDVLKSVTEDKPALNPEWKEALEHWQACYLLLVK